MIFYLVLLFSLKASLVRAEGAAAQATVAQAQKADYVLESGETSVVISPQGTYELTDKSSFKALNESGRTAISLREIPFTPGISTVKVLEAYSTSAGIVTHTNLKEVVERSYSDSIDGLRDLRKLIIPFSNVKVGSLVTYRSKIAMSKPLVPGIAFFSLIFGSRYPELKQMIEITSRKRIGFSVFDRKKLLSVKESMEAGVYRVVINTAQPTDVPKAGNGLNLVSTGGVPMVLISTASSWQEIVAPLSARYESILKSKMPKEFLDIVRRAQEHKTGVEQINYVTTELSKIIAYSGNWVTQEKMYFPQGNEQVIKYGKGDCKDFSNAMTAILRKLGYDATVALVTMASPENRTFRDVELSDLAPSTDYFNHAITYVKLSATHELWLDPTRGTGYAEGIWPELLDSPALILKKGISRLVKLPSVDPSPNASKINRSVSSLSAEKAQWKGSLESTGQDALQLKWQKTALGPSKFESALPRLLLGTAVSSNSVFLPPDEAFNVSQAEARFTFDVLGSNPIEENVSKELSLRIPVDVRVALLFLTDGESGAYLGQKTKVSTQTNYPQVMIDDAVMGDCYVLSPWLDFKREVKSNFKGTIVTEVMSLKKSIVTPQEMQDKSFGYFASNLRSCLSTSALSARKLGPMVTKGAVGNLSAIRRLPPRKESFKYLEDALDEASVPDREYAHLKAKRICDEVLAVDPQNTRARVIRAMSIRELGYISGAKFEKSYNDFALAELDDIIQTHPHDPHAYFSRAGIYFGLEKYKEALKDAVIAYSKAKQHPRYVAIIAKTYSRLGKLDKAKEWLKGAHARAKGKADLDYVWKAADDISYDCEDLQMQLEARTARLALRPDSPWAMHNLALTLSLMGKIDEAISKEREALKIMEFGMAKNQLAKMLTAKAQKTLETSFAQASSSRGVEESLIEANKLDPEYSGVYPLLASLYIKRSEVEKESDWIDNADLYIDEGLKRFPENEALQECKRNSHAMKVAMWNHFKARGINPTGRWPAAFRKGSD